MLMTKRTITIATTQLERGAVVVWEIRYLLCLPTSVVVAVAVVAVPLLPPRSCY